MAKRSVEILLKLKDETKKSSKSAVENIEDIEKQAALTGKNTVASFSSMTAAATAFAVAAAAALAGIIFVKKFTDQFVETGDQLDKLSIRLGVSIDMLSAYHFAAKKAGIETTTLNMAWQRMARRISEAAGGMGEAKNALIEMGLSAKYLNDLSPDEQFKEIMKAIEGAGNQADRLRLAMRLFDSEGVAMIQMLGTMEESLGLFKETAPDMELVARASRDWKDSTADLSLAILDLKASAFVPWLQTLSQKIQDFTEFIKEAKKQTQEMEQYRRGTSTFEDIFGSPEEIEHLSSSVSHLLALIDKDFTPVEFVDLEEIKQAVHEFEELEAAMLHVREMAQLTADEIFKNMEKAPEVIKDFTDAFNEFDLEIMRTLEDFEELQNVIEETTKVTDETSDAARRLGSAVSSTFSSAIIDIFINKAKSLNDILMSVANSLLRIGLQFGISSLLSPVAAVAGVASSAAGSAGFIGPMPVSGVSGASGASQSLMAGQSASYVSPYDLPMGAAGAGNTILMNVGIPESRAGIVRMQDGVAELLDNRSKGII